MSDPKATARLAGIVHGVVVQISDRGAVEVAVERVDDRELDPDRRRGLLVVFDLRFGERRLLDGRPHDRLRAAIELVGHGETHDLARDLRLRREGHGRVGVLPVALDAEALELLALHVDPMLGEGAALAAELDDRHRVLVLALGAVLPPRSSTRSAGRGSPSRARSWNRGRASPASARRCPSGSC